MVWCHLLKHFDRAWLLNFAANLLITARLYFSLLHRSCHRTKLPCRPDRLHRALKRAIRRRFFFVSVTVSFHTWNVLDISAFFHRRMVFAISFWRYCCISSNCVCMRSTLTPESRSRCWRSALAVSFAFKVSFNCSMVSVFSSTSARRSTFSSSNRVILSASTSLLRFPMPVNERLVRMPRWWFLWSEAWGYPPLSCNSLYLRCKLMTE